MPLQSDPGFPRPRSLLDGLDYGANRDPFVLSGPIDRLSKREAENYVRLGQNIKMGVTGWARKMWPGESEADYAAYTTIRCNAMWDDLETRLRAEGHLPAK